MSGENAKGDIGARFIKSDGDIISDEDDNFVI